MIIKVRVVLKAKKEFGTTKIGDTMTLYNDVFDAMNGIAFYSIERSQWELVSYDLSTGLKDKNKKEIFSNDKMKIKLPMGGFWGNVHTEKIGIVRYEPDKGGFIVEWEYSRNQHHERLTCDTAFGGEII